MRICSHYIAKLQGSAHILFITSWCIFFYFLSCDKLHAQSIEQADHFFEAEQYYTASMVYEKIISRDSTNYRAAFQLGHCYRHLFAYQEAEKYYAAVAKNASQNFPLSLYYYAQMLKYKREYKEAIAWYDRFLKQSTRVSSEYIKQGEKEKQGCVQAMLALSANVQEIVLSCLPDPVNTNFQEFAPTIYRSDSLLAFSSTRVRAKNRISNRSGEGFSDQYFVKEDSLLWEDISKEAGFAKLNTKWSDASGSFTADGKRYYFTHCTPARGVCGIYVSERGQDKWSEAKILGEAVNLPGSNSKQPAISAGGDTLFFVSDRPGGQGGSDIWMSTKKEKDNWHAAINLGQKINSTQNEISPFFSSKDSLLIFASDGRQGMGGMDLYMIGINLEENELPLALPSPFNSSKDDCYLVYGNSTAYMTSNRNGNFDIYSFKKNEKQSFRQLLQGIHSELLTYIPEQGEVFDDIITDYSPLLTYQEENLTVMRSSGQDYLRNGSSRFVLSSDVNDILLEQMRDEQALTQGTTVALATNNTPDSLSESNLLISFSTFQAGEHDMVEINGTIVNANDSSAIATLSLYLLDENGIITKITTTNERGEFRFINLEASTSYQIRSANTDGQQNYRIENLKVFGYGDDFSTVNFENIYFDFNQSYLRNEARVTLDMLADFYHRYPSSVIEINAFTDSTGNDVYNLQLSRERGQAAFDYLLGKNVDRSSLVFNAKGVSTAITSSNSFVSQQLNRRVEFYVTGRNIHYESDIVTRMLRPEVTLYALSNATGMDIEEIKRLNGISGNEIQAYKPIRIYQWALERAPTLFYQMHVRSE